MSEKVIFKYFEGQDVEQFTFYRIPKQLFTLSCFRSLSSDAKILYGLMLDRISLSVKNHWFDEKNRAYIYFSIDDVMELLGCGRNKAIKCMKELDANTGIGLTQKRRQGFGKSNMIYVKTFLVESQAEMRKEEQAMMDMTQDLFRRIGEDTIHQVDDLIGMFSGDSELAEYEDIADHVADRLYGEEMLFADSVEGMTENGYVELDKDTEDDGKQTSVSESQKEGVEEFSEEMPGSASLDGLNKLISLIHSPDSTGKTPESTGLHSSDGPDGDAEKFDIQTNGGSGPDTEVYKTNSKKFTKQTPRSPHNKLQEVCFWDPNKNKYNKTEYSDPKSYRILSGDIPEVSMQPERNQNDKIRYDLDRNHIDQIFGSFKAGEETGRIYALIRENLDLDDLLMVRPNDRDLIMEIYSLIVEMVSCRSEEIVIASARYPAELVRSRFLKLKYDHIMYVMDCLEKSITKINNFRKYLLATLFNAPVTMEGYYRAEVRHDMPYLARG